jgi:hypothetical protein
VERKLLAAVFARTAPDLVNLNPLFGANLASKGGLRDLGPLLPPGAADAYLPRIWKAARQDGAQIAVPWYLTVRLTFAYSNLLLQACLQAPARRWQDVPAYAEAVEALFSVSYTAKFALKKSTPSCDYAVMPLEGLWWADDLTAFTNGDRTQWLWTLMILQPPMVSAKVIEAAIEAVARKKNLPALSKLRLEEFTEGRCAQTLHIGPFTEEGPTIQRVHDFIEARTGLRGKHHEIYLSDIRRAAPAKWKTILRQPME